MRTGVKVGIDAFDGTVTASLADPRDPLVRTLAKVFPGIFQPLDAMSADLRAHLRYPEDLFRVQTDMYATYHMAEPEIFYHREDQWQDRKSTRLNSSHGYISYAVFCLKKKKKKKK